MPLGCKADLHLVMKTSRFELSLWKCLSPTVDKGCTKYRVHTGLTPVDVHDTASQAPAVEEHKVTDHIYIESSSGRTVY